MLVNNIETTCLVDFNILFRSFCFHILEVFLLMCFNITTDERSSCNKRRRVPPNQTIINCDLYINLESSSNSMVTYDEPLSFFVVLSLVLRVYCCHLNFRGKVAKKLQCLPSLQLHQRSLHSAVQFVWVH